MYNHNVQPQCTTTMYNHNVQPHFWWCCRILIIRYYNNKYSAALLNVQPQCTTTMYNHNVQPQCTTTMYNHTSDDAAEYLLLVIIIISILQHYLMYNHNVQPQSESKVKVKWK